MVTNQKNFSTYINANYGINIGFKNSYLFNTLNHENKETILNNYTLNKETTGEFLQKMLKVKILIQKQQIAFSI